MDDVELFLRLFSRVMWNDTRDFNKKKVVQEPLKFSPGCVHAPPRGLPPRSVRSLLCNTLSATC